MGRVSQVVGWAMIILPLLPIAWAASRVIGPLGSVGTWVSAITFTAPLFATMVGGVALVTLGKMLVEITELRQTASYAAQLLAQLADKR